MSNSPLLISALVNKLRTTHAKTYPTTAPANVTPPYVVVQKDSAFRERHYGTGANYATARIDHDFELHVYGETETECYKLANSLINAVENFQGSITSLSSPIITFRVWDIQITSEIGNYETSREFAAYSIFITVTTGG